MKDELKELLDECTQELEDIDKKISELKPFDKTKNYLTQYALIKSCGTVEYVYRSIVADYFSQFAVPQMDTYIESTVRSGSMSAKYDNMRGLLNKFDEAWAETFKTNVQNMPDGQIIIAASNSLVANRHTFAHGGVPSATFKDIKQYYNYVLKLINEFDAVVK